jgi:hypothetical protein
VDAYKRAVGVYTTAQRRFQGLLRDDFKLEWKELKRSREACEAADEALMAHWRKEHTDLAETVAAAPAGSV